jgi:hypothetical protein
MRIIAVSLRSRRGADDCEVEGMFVLRNMAVRRATNHLGAAHDHSGSDRSWLASRIVAIALDGDALRGFSISLMSSLVSSIFAAPRFSWSRSTFVVPGIDTSHT